VNDASQAIATASALSSEAGLALDEHGFVVLPGAVPARHMEELSDAYDEAVASAAAEDMRVGSTSTRVSDFANRGAEFDSIYVFPPLLAACRRVIGKPFKLSSFVARTVRPCVTAQGLHVDLKRDSADWPLVGFILMIDAFLPENGATCFVPGSHRWANAPAQSESSCEATVQACGAAGSMLIFNGSAWHGHAANKTDRPRRSLQGAFIPRAGRAATDFAASMRPDTRARLGPVALSVLAP
jgi:ectoine hydroxylase-related dioxygenase (phytanoyl-CoA dioxygenase family)